MNILAPIGMTCTGEDRFSSLVAQRNSFGTVFGGQLMGLAIEAAGRTVGERFVHAASGVFLRRGRLDVPVDIAVARLFDGGSFCARQATLSQQDEPIFSAHASFAREEAGIEHWESAPTILAPDALENVHELLNGNDRRIAEGLAKRVQLPAAVDLRPVCPRAYAAAMGSASERMAWLRVPTIATVSQNSQRAMLAYLSDYWLAGTAAQIHDHSPGASGLFLSSLNQSIWFYRDLDLAEWLLFRPASPAAQDGRAVARSDVFDRAGKIVASTVQETVLRKLRPR